MPLGEAGGKRWSSGYLLHGKPREGCHPAGDFDGSLSADLLQVPPQAREPTRPSRRDGMARSQPQTPQRPPLLATTTNEPFQPVRLYFAVPDAGAVRAKVKRIACIQEVPAMDC